ncbi:cysteine/glutathione ABC transporter ATP-binding protein/permease CydC, partial [Vibrio parahaemolyticus]|nr:cysteine/glutathione ABC transporter ATP-binding protein/permease CydC [Vibrio parahaemolyticus]
LLMPIAGAVQSLGATLTSARRLNEVSLAEPDVVFPEHSKREEKPLDIEIINIDFAYPDGQQKELKDLSRSLPLGS